MWWAVAAALDDELLGFGGRPMRVGSFELMCQCMLHTDTLGEALARALRFIAVVVEDPVGTLRVTAEGAEIVLRERGPARSAFAYRTLGMFVHGVACWLVGRRLPMRAVDFRCASPAARSGPAGSYYRSFFGAKVGFGRPVTRFVLDPALLELTPVRDQHALRAFLRKVPARLLAPYSDEGRLTAKIRGRLRGRRAVNWPSVEELAGELELPASTLRHRLASEGQTYRGIKDEIRRGLAIDRLTVGSKSIADIAAELGFLEPSAFHRAFRKWTGKSPAAFRRESRGELDQGIKPLAR